MILNALLQRDPLRVIKHLGGGGMTRFVGGCVRDAALGIGVNDIDMATILPPESVLARLNESGIKTVPTGLDHGTITAVFDSGNIEITTLRIDKETDGRHAQVAFTDDWKADAQRRDFTLNTLLADEHGTVFDPLGCGLEDLKAGRVRFVGQADQRITEDVLRILRFFRFYGAYGKGAPDPEALQACAAHAALIVTLSRERITQEFFKILKGDKAAEILKLMFDHGVLTLCNGTENWDEFEAFCERQVQEKARDALARFYALNMTPAVQDQVFCLSKAQKSVLAQLAQLHGVALETPQAIKEALYQQGRGVVRQAYLLRIDVPDRASLDLIESWGIPTFPLKGADLMAEGFTPGPALGLELKKRETAWIKNGFKAT